MVEGMRRHKNLGLFLCLASVIVLIVALQAFPKKAQAEDSMAPAAPTGLTAVPGDREVRLDWSDNTEPDFSYYAVRRSSTTTDTNNTAQWTRLTGNHTISEVVDGSLVNGTPYNYYVTAVDTSGNVSARSSVVSATPTVPAPTPTPTPEPTPEPTPTPIPDGMVIFGGNFESDDLSSLVKAVRVQGSTGSHAFSTEQARTGTRSLKITLNAANGKTSRYQLVMNTPDGQPGQDRYYGVSFYLGSDWNLAQVTNNADYFISALLGFRYTATSANGPGNNLNGNIVNSVPTFETYTNLTGGVDDNRCNTGRADCLRLGEMIKGQWIDFVFRVKWSLGSDGVREVWRNGVKLGTYNGRTTLYSSPFEHRIGFYEGGKVNHKRTLYVDNYRIGTSYAAVDPSQ
jgi:hypothetical protein